MSKRPAYHGPKRRPLYRNRQLHSSEGIKNRITKENDIKFEIGSWDVNGLGSPEEVEKYFTEDLHESPDVVCLQRANLPAPNTETKKYQWHCSGTSGSAILLKKTCNLELKTFNQICDQICMSELEGKGGIQINVISSYIPPVEDYLCKELWLKLEDLITSIPSSVSFILGGNFHAQVGHSTPSLDFVLAKRKLYHESSNENGKTLATISKKCHLKLLASHKKGSNELFNVKDGKTVTQESFFVMPHLRQSFVGDGYHVWHNKFNHAFLRFTVQCSPVEPFYTESGEEESAEFKPPVIANWNIKSATPAKVDSTLNNYSMPIACIQELFLASNEDIVTDNYTWHSSKKLWAKNVGILVKRSPNISLSSFEALSENLCAATIKFYGQAFIVISLFLPAMTDTQHEQVLSQTKELIKGVPEGIMLILGGDFGSVVNNEEDLQCAKEFVNNLANETNTDVVEKIGQRKPNSTQVVRPGKRRAHHMLVSQATSKDKLIFQYYRWIPLFESPLMCVVVRERLEKPQVFTFDTIKAMDNLSLDFKTTEEEGRKIKLTTFKVSSDKEDSLRGDIASLVMADDVEKFKDCPPSAEDLGRMLKNLVLFYWPNRNSLVIMTTFAMLVKALSDNKFGPLVIEEITETTENPKKICRIKWQNILLGEEIGKENDSIVALRQKVVSSIVAKLSETCYTVKSKKSYFNKGKAPLLMGTTELADVLKIVKKESFPTMEDVLKHVDSFIAEDTDAELVFGEDFPKEDLLQLAEYCIKKNELIDFRFFKTFNSRTQPDYVAVFKKRSPQYVRDLLIKTPKNFKYYLIHPCGLGGNFEEFSKKFVAEVIDEEQKLFNKFNSDLQKKHEQPVKQGGQTSTNRNRQKPTQTQSNSAGRTNSNRNRQKSNSSGGQKRRFDSMNSSANDSRSNNVSFNSSLGDASKKRRIGVDISFKVDLIRWADIRPLVVVWPITVRSQLEDRPEQVLADNFTVEFKTKTLNNASVTAVFVVLTHYNGYGRMYCIAKGNTTRNASRVALDLLIKHCTIIKPNPNYLCNGRTPNFIRYKVPCQLTPRTYLLVDRYETGPLSWQVIENLVERFLNTNEEELFFDRDSFTLTEKLALIETIPKLAPSKLYVRHFGDDPKLADRYVCVYKMKPKQDILREILKMRSQHPKYVITTNRLPADIEYSIF